MEKTVGIAHWGSRLKNRGDMQEITALAKAADGTGIDKREFVKGSPYVFFKAPGGYLLDVGYEALADRPRFFSPSIQKCYLDGAA